MRLSPIEVREEVWLRRVLRKHVRLTGSPRAAAFLNSSAPIAIFAGRTSGPAVLHRADLGAGSEPIQTAGDAGGLHRADFAQGRSGHLENPVPKDRDRSSAIQPGLA